MTVRTAAAAVLLVLSAALGVSGEQADPEVVLRDISAAWLSRGVHPVVASVRSETGRPLSVRVESREENISQEVVLPPSAPVRLEYTIMGRYASLSYSSGGETGSRSVQTAHAEAGYYSGTSHAPLICVNSFLLREFELLDESLKFPDMRHRAVSLDDLPYRWQSYAGLISIILMEPREAASLRPEQRNAISRWIRWFGGRIWLAGSGAEAAAEHIGVGLAGLRAEEIRGGAVRCYTVGNGRVYVQPEPDAAVTAAALPLELTVNPLLPYLSGARYRTSPLLEPLMGVSANIIIGSLLVLGIILGPVNYLFIRRRKNSLLFFITTPIIAILGTIAVVAGAFIEEGGGGSVQLAVMVQSGDSREAMLFDARGVRSGFIAGTPEFPADTLPLPLSRQLSVLHSDVSSGVRLSGGWLIPRFATGFLLVRPVVSRMQITVTEENGQYYAVNDIGYTVHRVAALLPDGTFGQAADIAPGGRKILLAHKDDDAGEEDEESGEVLLGELLEKVKVLTDGEPSFTGIAMIAECAGLPYLEDGGLGSRRLSGGYYYVAAGAEKGVGP